MTWLRFTELAVDWLIGFAGFALGLILCGLIIIFLIHRMH